MAIYAVVDGAGAIINRIVLDNVADWPVPDGYSLVDGAYLEIGGTYLNGVYAAPVVAAPPLLPQSILSQDLMAQFTTDDATKIQTAVAGNVQFWLLWSSLQAQSEPMVITNARFMAGWNALVQVLGQPRMTAIAAALGVTV